MVVWRSAVIMFALGGLVGGGACGRGPVGAGTAGAVPTTHDATLTFAWPDDAEAVVTQTSEDDEGVSVARFRLVAKVEASGERWARMRDMEFVTVRGMDARDPALHDLLGPLLATASAVPGMRIDPSGRLIGYQGGEELLGAVEDMMVRLGANPLLTEILAEFRTPSGRAMMETSARGYWFAWCEQWLGELPAHGVAITRRGAANHDVDVRLLSAPGARTLEFEGVTTYRDVAMEQLVLDSLRRTQGIDNLAITLQHHKRWRARVDGTTGLPVEVLEEVDHDWRFDVDGRPPREQHKHKSTRWEFVWQ